ncbi:uncharacterized protein [Haliotis cracherodii]|uniref:uncharacterized protein n=1 Tax=Haliotis cracherodii TaxID=6455 RepID=UPI0039EAE41F
MNLLACLAHWRALVALLAELEGHWRAEFRTLLEPVGEHDRQQTLRFQCREEGRQDKGQKSADRVVTWSASSEVEATSEDEAGGLEAIDAHFHLDRTGRDLLGQRRGHSVDELLDHPRAKQGVQKPVQLEKLPPIRVVHLHSFTERATDVTAWLADFPQTYFSINYLVQGFDRWQKEGLRSIPRNRLLLETDSLQIFWLKMSNNHQLPEGWCKLCLGTMQEADVP